VDIHGQRETESPLHPAYQLQLLDAASGNGAAIFPPAGDADTASRRAVSCQQTPSCHDVLHQLSQSKFYLRRLPDGQIRSSPSYEPLFGDLLHESHPTRTIEVRSRQVPCPRYSVCWSALERYAPRSADQLAALRASRECKKAQREANKWRENNPLLVWAEALQAEEEAEQKRGPTM
jgi:hypothetical protein